jgi:ComF family protein
MNIIHFLRELIFPNGCGICGNMLLNIEEACLGLCEICMQKLDFSLDDNRCGVCGRALISEIDICMHCRKTEDASNDGDERFLDAMIALYPYTGIYKRLLSAYKFNQHKQLAHFLTSKLIAAGNDLCEKTHGSFSWVPVPPRPGKIKQKGWDQIDYLADIMKKEKSIRVNKCLRRLNKRAQKTLNRKERLSNLKGQIICLDKAPQNAIVFDDVVTTGATLEACAEALKKAGTEHVYAIFLFYDYQNHYN